MLVSTDTSPRGAAVEEGADDVYDLGSGTLFFNTNTEKLATH